MTINFKQLNNESADCAYPDSVPDWPGCLSPTSSGNKLCYLIGYSCYLLERNRTDNGNEDVFH